MVLGVGLIFGIGYPLVNGMLYKIVPFLSWFHLQNRQLALMCLTVNIPHMKEFVSDRASRGQFYSYLVTLLLALLAVWNPGWLVRPAALMLISTNLLLIINLVRAVYRFRSAYRQLSEMSAASVGIR